MRRLLLLLTLVLLFPAAPASAQQSPAGCASSGIAFATTWGPAKGRVGLPSTLSAVVTQPGGAACDVSGMTVEGALPGANRQPAATTLVQAANLPIIAPQLGFTVAAEPASGTAPLDVTFRFTLTNLGTPPEPLSAVSLAHPFCTPLYQSGDTNNDNAIDAAETWRYACTHRFTALGEYTLTSNAAAFSASAGQVVNATTVNTVVRVEPAQALGRLTLTTVADPASGFAPLSVTYTYTVRNDGTGAVKDVTVADAGCSPVTTAAGTAPLAAGATRTFTCARVLGTAGTFSAGAIASGIDVASGRAVSSEPFTTAVTTTAAPTATATPDPIATTSPTPEPSPASTPTPTPTPRATPRPAATISTLAGKRKVAKKTRKVTIATIACPTGATCSITAPKTVKLKLGKKTYTLKVTAARTLAGGRKLNVTLTLSRAAYAQLKSGTVSVKLSARATGARTTSMTVKATLRR